MLAHRWHDMTSLDVAAVDLGRRTAIVPVWTIGKHGPLLPLPVDCKLKSGAIEAAQDMPDYLSVCHFAVNAYRHTQRCPATHRTATGRVAVSITPS